MQGHTVDGFMDYVDALEELGNAPDGVNIYPTQEDVLKERPCSEKCGIVRVEVTVKEVVQEPFTNGGDTRIRVTRNPADLSKTRIYEKRDPVTGVFEPIDPQPVPRQVRGAYIRGALNGITPEDEAVLLALAAKYQVRTIKIRDVTVYE